MERLSDNIENDLLNLNSISHPIDYKWSDKILGKFANTTDKHPRLENALCKIGYKASIGLGASMSELIFRRLNGSQELTDEMIQDIKYRLDAMWISSIDPLYVYLLRYNSRKESSEGEIHGPLWIMLSDIELLSFKFNEKSYYIHEHIVGISLLSEYLSPQKKIFREWFTNILKKASEVYPCSYDYDNDDLDGKYDYSNEPPVFREFFFGSEPYDEEVAKQKAREFMQSVKDSGNPYLRSPEEMIELGFKGTPYTI